MNANEKAVDVALSETRLLITLCSGLIPISIGLFRLLTEVSSNTVIFIGITSILFLISIISGIAFYGSITHNLQVEKRIDSDILQKKSAKNIAKAQWVSFILGLIFMILTLLFLSK